MANTKTAFLAALGIVGFYGTWGRCAMDGSLGRILQAVFVDDQSILPGTDDALLKRITGIWPLDRLLAVLIAFFWEATDGSHPTTSAIGLYFATQHMAIVASMYIDNWRLGKASSGRLSPTLWALIFQCTAIGPAGPIYAALYLASPTRSSSSSSSPTPQLLLLPVSLLGGYIIPTILMGLPSPTLVSPTFKQLAIAIWNVFPLWLALLQAALLPLLGPALRRWTRTTPTSALRLVYAVIALAAAGAHAGALTVAACSALFPTLFVNPVLLSPARLFVPPTTTGAAAPTVGEGVRGFMLWDQAAGYATMLFLACVALREAVGERRGRSGGKEEGAGVGVLWLLGMAVGGSVVVGPGCTVLALQWARDELVERKKGKDK